MTSPHCSPSSDYSYTGTRLETALGDQSIRWGNLPWEDPVAPLSQALSTRVCNRCILKKLKCDLKRPTCSRCLETSSPCMYSCTKKKPGPVKGSRRKARITASLETGTQLTAHSSSSSKDDMDCSYMLPSFEETSLPQHGFQQSGDLTTSLLRSTRTPVLILPSTTSPVTMKDQPSHVNPQLTFEQEKELLHNFHRHIHPSIPLFREDKFFQQYECGAISRNLVLTILAVTAKILGPPSFWADSSVNDFVGSLLHTDIMDEDSPSKQLSLDNFRQACLLGFYAFHQYPGERAWMRICHLTRKAYQCGLHQIDNPDRGLLIDCSPMNDDEVEEWRYVWWCIYCLDSYSNIAAATPFVVENESIQTSLVATASVELAESTPDRTRPKFLPAETGLLWKTIRDITTNGGNFNFNVHIVTTTILREAATVHRLRTQNRSERLQARVVALEDHLSAVRLALPARYLNGARNVLMDESSSDHHARLICVLHLHIARVLISLPLDPERNETDWLYRWQQSLEYCQDIVSVVRQWDGQFCSTVDPAVCLIVQAALMFLHLHSTFASNSQPELQERLAMYKDMLLLFLRQFACTWYLPRFLIMAFERFSQVVSGPLAPKDIDRILRRWQGQLHQSWLNFLSLPSDLGSPPTWEDIFQSLSSGEWNFDDWEAVAEFSASGDMTAAS